MLLPAVLMVVLTSAGSDVAVVRDGGEGCQEISLNMEETRNTALIKQQQWSEHLPWLVYQQRLFKAKVTTIWRHCSENLIWWQNENFQKERKWAGWSTIDRTSIWSGMTEIVLFSRISYGTLCVSKSEGSCFPLIPLKSRHTHFSWREKNVEVADSDVLCWGEGCENVQRVET